MSVYKGLVTVETESGKPTYVDITKQVDALVQESDIKEGTVTVISCHTTCALFSDEFDHDRTGAGDLFLQADLNDGLQKIFPSKRIGLPIAILARNTLRKWKAGLLQQAIFLMEIVPCFGTGTRICVLRY